MKNRLLEFEKNQCIVGSSVKFFIFVALDAADKKNKKFPWYYAFGFGLLHGFGFSGALSEIGINNNELALSLLFFNVGIEIAQLAIIPIPFLIIFAALSSFFSFKTNAIRTSFLP